MTMQTSHINSFDSIVDHGIWLEDNRKYSRYATNNEDSTWVCNHCFCVDADPYEGDCDCSDDD